MTVFAQLPTLLAAMVLVISAWLRPKAPAAPDRSDPGRAGRASAARAASPRPWPISQRRRLHWSGSKVFRQRNAGVWRPSWAPIAASNIRVAIGALAIPSVASATAERPLADSSVLALVLADTYVFPAVYDDDKARAHAQSHSALHIPAFDDLVLADPLLDFGADLPALPAAHLCDLFTPHHDAHHGDLLWT